MTEMPFSSPAAYLAAVGAPDEGVEGLWFVFRGDRLLVEPGNRPPGSWTTRAHRDDRPGRGCRARRHHE